MTNNRVERDEEDLVRLYLTDIGQYELLDKEDEVNKIRFSEVRDDDKGFMLWFDPMKNFQTYKIYQDFGSQDLTWNLVSKPLGE